MRRILVLTIVCFLFFAGVVSVEAATSVEFENAGEASLPAGVVTFGQVFLKGEIPSGSGLVAKTVRTTIPAQIDVKTTWPDGSAKMAVVAVERPTLAAGRSASYELLRGAAPTDNLSLSDGLKDQSFVVDLAITGRPTTTISVLEEVRRAVASGAITYWQKGPLATEGRVETRIPNSSFRLIFDVAVYKGGGFVVKAQYANDRAMEAIGGPVTYGVTATLNGRVVERRTVTQRQYQAWFATYSSNDAHGTQGLGAPDRGWLNIQHDPTIYVKASVIPAIDDSLEPLKERLDGYKAEAARRASKIVLDSNELNFLRSPTNDDKNLLLNSAFYLPPAIDWLRTNHPYAAARTLQIAQLAGTAQIRTFAPATNRWLTNIDVPKLFPMDGFDSYYTVRNLTQRRDGSEYSNLFRYVTPDFSFIPYVRTGERWLYDNLMAEGARAFTYFRKQLPHYYDISTDFGNLFGNITVLKEYGNSYATADSLTQGSIFAFQLTENALWASIPSSFENGFFGSVAYRNWKALDDLRIAWINDRYTAPDHFGRASTLVSDMFVAQLALAHSRGGVGARANIEWPKKRYLQSPPVVTARTADFQVKWSLSALASIWSVTGDAAAKQAYERILVELSNSPAKGLATKKSFQERPIAGPLIPGVYEDSVTAEGTVVIKLPTISLAVQPTAIEKGKSATLRWSTTDATSCSGTPLELSGVTGRQAVSPEVSTSYTVSCSGPGGSTSASVLLRVAEPQVAPAQLSPDGTSITPSSTTGLRTREGSWVFDPRSGATGHHLIKLNDVVIRGFGAIEMAVGAQGRLFARNIHSRWFMYHEGQWLRAREFGVIPPLPTATSTPSAAANVTEGVVQGVTDTKPFFFSTLPALLGRRSHIPPVASSKSRFLQRQDYGLLRPRY